MRRQSSLNVTWRHILLHGTIGIAVSLVFWFSGFLNGLEGKTYDLRASILADRSSFSDTIVLVVVDQTSIDWVSENLSIGWPWPRELFAAIIKNCTRRGAEAIGFDVIFTENSNFGVTDDIQLKNAMLQTGNFALGSVIPSNTSGQSKSWPDGIPIPQQKVSDRNDFLKQLPEYTRATFPLPDLITAGIVLSNVQHPADEDGIYRKIHPFVRFNRMLIPSLGIGLYLSDHPDAEIIFEKGKVIVDDRAIPVDSQGRALFHFRKPEGTYKTISAGSVIRNEFQFMNGEINETDIPDDLAGKYVLFGYTAPGLHDLRPTPTDGAFSGVEINATLLDNLLAQDFIRPSSSLRTVLTIIVLTFTATLILDFCQTQRRQIEMAILLPTIPVFLSLLFYKAGYNFKLVPIELAVITGTALTIIHRYLVVGRQERFIRHSFKHYLSPVVIEQLMENPEKLKLGGERKELTIFFSDLEGFTTISEGLAPEELTHLLNDYLTAMTDIILEEQGTVDKFEGDAIIAFWNAPMDVENHAELAVRAALRCQEKLAAMRPDFLEEYGKKMNMRIGINTGEAVVGNMGSSSRFDYTVLGDAVNLAARLEGANKHFGTYTMISEATHNLLGRDFLCREIARIKVVGRHEPVKVFEPLSCSGDALRPDYEIFNKALSLFYAGQCNKAYAEFMRTAQSDRTAGIYASKCRELSEKLPEHWDGVWELASK